jgi:hypothetical protein
MYSILCFSPFVNATLERNGELATLRRVGDLREADSTATEVSFKRLREGAKNLAIYEWCHRLVTA